MQGCRRAQALSISRGQQSSPHVFLRGYVRVCFRQEELDEILERTLLCSCSMQSTMFPQRSLCLVFLCLTLPACAASDELGNEPCGEKCDEQSTYKLAHYPSEDVLRCWTTGPVADCETVVQDYEIHEVDLTLGDKTHSLLDIGEGRYHVNVGQDLENASHVDFSYRGLALGRRQPVNNGALTNYPYEIGGAPVVLSSPEAIEFGSIFADGVEEVALFVDYDLGGVSEDLPFYFFREPSNSNDTIEEGVTVTLIEYTPGTAVYVTRANDTGTPIRVEPGATWLFHDVESTSQVDGY